MGLGSQGVIGEYKSGTQIIPADRLDLSIDDIIDYLNVDRMMLVMLLSKIGKKKVDEMEHSWWTQEKKADWVLLDANPEGGNWAGGAAVDGDIDIKNATDAWLFAVGDVVMLPHIDLTTQYLVTGVSSTTLSLLTVDNTTTKDFSANPNSDKYIFRVSTSFEEGSGKGTIKSEAPTKVYNMVQIFQTPMGLTTTAQHVKYRGTDEWTKQAYERAIDHEFDIEKQFFFGMRAANTTGLTNGVYQQHFMGGLTDATIGAQNTDSQASLTQKEWTTWLSTWLKYARSPLAFLGELIFEALSFWAEAKLQLVRSEDTLGMAIGRYTDPFGKEVMFTPHRELLSGSYAGYEARGLAFGVDISDLEYRYLDGLDTHVAVDIQDPDLKQKIDEWRSWVTLKIGNGKRHGILEDVAAYT